MTAATAAIISMLAAVSCETSTYDTSSTDNGETVSIAYLKSLCSGTVYPIRSDISICGSVVANDWLGEFYKSIVVSDSTGGIEICIDAAQLYRQLPVYSRITVFCNGMALGRVGGKIELGAYPSGDFPVDGLPAETISTYIRIDETACEPVPPAEKRPGEIGISDIGTLVVFRDISLAGDIGNGCWCETENGEYVTTRRRIVGDDGCTFAIQTRGSCIYAGEEMPTGKFSVSGIIDYSGGEYFMVTANHGIAE